MIWAEITVFRDMLLAGLSNPHLWEKSFWSGVTALGFGILFVTPSRVLAPVFLLGFGGGLLRFLSLSFGVHPVFSCFIAASFLGVMSIPPAFRRESSPFILSVPGIIPMIPGYYGYSTLMALVRLGFFHHSEAGRLKLISQMFQNGLSTVLIVSALSLGISLPRLLLPRNRGIDPIREKE